MSLICPECEEKIPTNSKECPECGAEIDASLRYSPVRVAVLVVSMVLILFVAVPSIVKTLFFSEGPAPEIGEIVPLQEIKESIEGDQVIKLVDVGLTPNPGESGEVRLNWKVTVKNQSRVPVFFDTDLRFLDEEGTEVGVAYRLETPLLGSATGTLQGSLSLPEGEADRIKNIRAIITPCDEVFAEEAK